MDDQIVKERLGGGHFVIEVRSCAYQNLDIFPHQ